MLSKSSKSEHDIVSLFSYSEAATSPGKLDATSNKRPKSGHCIVSLFFNPACLGLPLHLGDELLDCVKNVFWISVWTERALVLFHITWPVKLKICGKVQALSRQQNSVRNIAIRQNSKM